MLSGRIIWLVGGLVIIVGVIAIGSLLSVAFRQVIWNAWLGFSDPKSGFWVWAERLSWTVAIAGLTFGLYQVSILRRDQRRIAQELARQPDVLVGFFPLTESQGKKTLPQETDITATWQPNEVWSNPVDVTVVCYNAGERSARGVLYNFKFPTEFTWLTAIQRPAKHGQIVTSPDDGRPLWSIEDRYIHPHDYAPFGTAIRIPRRMAVIQIDAEVSMEDRPAVRTQLSMRVIVDPRTLT